MNSTDEQSWRTKHRDYYNMRICGYVDLLCTVITIISNMLVISIMTSKRMISPTNKIFTHITITESLTLLSFLPRLWHEFLRVDECSIKEHRTYIWEQISFHSYMFAFLFHHTSLWLALILGLWRYIAIAHPFKASLWCNMENSDKLVIAGYIFGVLVTIPPYLVISIEKHAKVLDRNGCNKNEEIFGQTIKLEEYPTSYKILFLGYGIFLKILPSLILSIFSYKLIIALFGVKKYRTGNTNISNDNFIENKTERTTIILLIILILFMIGEIPHGIGWILTAFKGPEFFWEYYYYIMEIINSIIHFSRCFNFIIYYAMSHKFRETFRTLILRNVKSSDNIEKLARSLVSNSEEDSSSNYGISSSQEYSSSNYDISSLQKTSSSNDKSKIQYYR